MIPRQGSEAAAAEAVARRRRADQPLAATVLLGASAVRPAVQAEQHLRDAPRRQVECGAARPCRQATRDAPLPAAR